ncbi:linear amide C-N hydrolase [Halodesulfovibrio marinisediminis]|uniref:Choloylglycine hydrolase n=1 Tax=Halodesulfovibrio marinisediminis DSM 17456 TaxID=1121457 RepID=A0A1N6E7M4_9BACT|nr:choloylglycine hydrolase family protein [Halodesulfovibrio marinisediminis]SIN79020.1 choloylglycine hydrolase [Halodesulfovibrio marinisediminis DSM 17456]
MRNIACMLLLACGVLWILSLSTANACTGIKVQSKDGATMFARTLEFNTPFKSNIMFVPKGQTWTSQAPNNQKGMTWKNQYAFLGPNGFDERMFFGGINEKGLYIGGFWFPQHAEYPTPTANDTTKIVEPVLVTALILGTCGTLEDVQKKIDEVQIAGVKYEKLGMIPPMHWIVIDSKGNAIVIEPLNGKITITQNPVGVITNSPQFTWHLQNLSNYMNVTADNCTRQKINDFTATPIGAGSGMLGLPGDFTPPSRFVRAALYSNAATPVQTADEALNLAFMLISNISIAKGLVRTNEQNGTQSTDYTQWTAVYDLQRRRCYFKTYDNQEIRVVHLDNLPKDGKKTLSIPMWDTKPEYKDMTEQAK